MELEIAIIISSVILSAFFSGMEIAFVSANKLQIELEKKKQGVIGHIITVFSNSSSKFITTMLVGNNIALVVYSYFMGELILESLPIEAWNNFSKLLLQTSISTLIILVTAEFLPKAIFRIYANQALRIFSIPAYVFYMFFYVFSEIINRISDFFLRVFFKTTSQVSQKEFGREEIGHYISEQLETQHQDDELDSEIQIFQNALEFQNLKAREIMLPRTEICALEIHESVRALRQRFIDTGYSKIIIYKNSLDDILGYVSAFELFKKPSSIKSILLPVEVVPESMMINDVLDALMRKRKSVAVVVDEYGGTSGIITVEDIVEELFGEIEDEHDSVALLHRQLDEDEFHLSARLEIDFINETYDFNIPKDESYETLGGYIISHTESIPEKDQVLEIDHFRIKILQVASSKIEEVHVKLLDIE